jgi:site-specific DNA recombinase
MTQQEPKRAVIYCRVSDSKQVSRGDGLNSQETRCREFARARGLEVVEVFRDDMSGSRTDRPGIQAMIRYLRAEPENHHVLIDDISRFARDMRGHLDLRDLLRETGAVLASPNMEFKDDADSTFREYISALFAQYQREKNAEQTKNRMKARVQNGYWTMQAPVGYKFGSISGRGKMLLRDEPVASVVQEALEGYAFARFEKQADVQRFLQDNPLFPKDSRGVVRHQRVSVLLKQCLYAGYLEFPKWDVSLRQAQHEPLITFQTWKMIQDRLAGGFYAPRKKNVNEDFPLRGFVMCDDCGTPLTSCWSKGTHNKYAYYLCPKRGCASYGKSIRRADIEGQFDQLLQSLTPSDSLFRVARLMFKELWDHRLS